MNICVVGIGYVGLVTGVCLADAGHHVMCIDIDSQKIEGLKNGVMPIYEIGLKELVEKNYTQNRLSFSTSLQQGVLENDVIFVAVGTPEAEDGSVDMRQVNSVVDSIAEYMDAHRTIVVKSTVAVGTNAQIEKRLGAECAYSFDIVSNPEFLQEGTAISNMQQADRIVIGAKSAHAFDIMDEIYKPFDAPILHVDPESAEIIKYASNSFLATKVSFINEIANMCDLLGGDVTLVAKGMGMDPRIGSRFLRAGIGYGGSCFGKDTSAIVDIAKAHKYDFEIIRSTISVNEKQRYKVIDKLQAKYPNLTSKTIALLGLTFKPNTDDVRDAPSIDIAKKLIELGANVHVYDPLGTEMFISYFENDTLQSFETPMDAIKNADAALLLTEWPQIVEMDFKTMKALLNKPILIDGRNAWDKEKALEMGFDYQGIGR